MVYPEDPSVVDDTEPEAQLDLTIVDETSLEIL